MGDKKMPLPSCPISPSLKLRDLLPPTNKRSYPQNRSKAAPISTAQRFDDQQINQKLINKVQHHNQNGNNQLANNQNVNHLMNAIMNNNQSGNIDINRILQLLSNNQLTVRSNAYLSHLLQQ